VGVRAVGVADQVQRHARVGLGDLAEEYQELLVPVPGVAGAGDLAGRGLQRGEQRGGAVPDVVVAALFRHPGPRRQYRRGPLQRLGLGFLIHAQHDRLIGGIQVQPDDVADLSLQPRIGGELEALGPPRLQAPLPPHVRHLHIRHAQLSGQ
jgi:hypothetical protein